jgi:hypothetical protein
MKKLLPTLVLLVVLIAGYAYARSENFFKEEAKTDPALFTMQGSDITGLTLVSGESQVELKKNGDSWDMVKPDAYPVQKGSVDSMAGSLAGLKVKGAIDEAPANLADFGLDKPARQVEAVLSDGSTKKLLIGNPLPVAGTTYVKTEDGAAVYEADDTALSEVEKTAEDFLDKSVLKLDYDKVAAVEFDWKGDKWTLTKSEKDKKAYESAWKLDDKDLKPEDGSGVLDQLTFLATDRLPQPRQNVALDKAELAIRITQDDGTEQVYSGKIDNELVRIAKSDGTWAYAVASTAIDGIADQMKKLKTGESQEGDAAGASPAASAAPAQ